MSKIKALFSKYFHSTKAVIRSLSFLILVVSIAFMVLIWLVSMIYAISHFGQLPSYSKEINFTILFFTFYCPTMSIMISWPVFYFLDHELWDKSLYDPSHR